MPGLVDSGLAQWLRDPGLYTSWANAALPAGLQPSAVDTEILSPLSTKAAADAEAARQGLFMGGPLARDVHTIKGQRRDLIGQCVTLTIAALGYDAGVACFVIGVEELEQNLTKLTVLRKLT